MWVKGFLKSISSKVNIRAQLEFDLDYFAATVQEFIFYEPNIFISVYFITKIHYIE